MSRKRSRAREKRIEGAERARSAAPRGDGWLLAAVLLLTAVIYSRSLANGFIYFDDPDAVVNNPYIRELSAANVVRWFTKPVQFMYMPLALISYAIDFQIGALDPLVYHLHNLLLHLGCVALVYWVFQLLTRKPGIAAFVSLAFAIHPVNVDTVAWVAARTNLLAALFSLAALGCYGLYVEREHRPRYLILSCLSFALAASAKASAVVLPVTLFLWDSFQGRRWDRRLLLEKLPFFAVALFFGILAVAMRVDDPPSVHYDAWQRVLIFLYALAHYCVRLVFPWPLSMNYAYPVPDGPWLPLPFFLAPLLLVAIVWGLGKLGVPRKVSVFGLSFFVLHVALSQSVLLIDNFMANRYAYLAYLGLFFVAADVHERVWGAPLPGGAGARLRAVRGVWAGALVVAVAAFSALAYARTFVWRDSLALFDDVIRKGQGSAWVYGTRGLVKLHTDDLPGARRDLDQALRLDPSYTPALCYRGTVNYLAEEYQAALSDLDRALANDPAIPGAYRDRGKVKLALRDDEGALADFDRAIALDPRSEARLWRGTMRRDRGDARGALADLDAWIAVAPRDGEAFYRRGLVKLELSDRAAACEDVAKARSLGFAPPAGVVPPDCG